MRMKSNFNDGKKQGKCDEERGNHRVSGGRTWSETLNLASILGHIVPGVPVSAKLNEQVRTVVLSHD